jgi:pimeloyl-ACP methyl ester carboxylesterase
VPFANTGEIELYYEESGSGDPLLLIMGLGADSNAWVRQRPALSRHHRTIVFDNRGVGRSAKPPGPYSIRQMADEAAGLLAHLGIERAHVVGVSMGGMIAQELALHHGPRVGALVLAVTYPEPDDGAHALRDGAFQHFAGPNGTNGHTAAALGGLDPITLFQYMLPTVFSERFIREELATLAGDLMQGLAGFSLDGILAQLGACLEHRTTDRLHQIDRPTLVLSGTDDRLIPPRHSERIAERIPGARLVRVEGGTHGINLEHPERFNDEVLRFLAEHPLNERD